MEWTTRYFLHHSRKWANRGEEVIRPGAMAYATRQSSQWRRLACDAEKIFRVVNIDYIPLIVT